MKLTNCINCGAYLHSNKCEYCGTSYEKKEIEKFYVEDNIKLVKQDGNKKITLNVYGQDIDFYIASIQSKPIYDEVQYITDMSTKYYVRPISENIEITLISY